MAVSKEIRKKGAAGGENRLAQDERRPRIKALAYQLWLERGAPIGSPDTDWLEAEARLAGQLQRTK